MTNSFDFSAFTRLFSLSSGFHSPKMKSCLKFILLSLCHKVSVSVPGSMGVPAHIHHITHGPNPVTTTQLDVVARSTPPIQQVSITTVPQVNK